MEKRVNWNNIGFLSGFVLLLGRIKSVFHWNPVLGADFFFFFWESRYQFVFIHKISFDPPFHVLRLLTVYISDHVYWSIVAVGNISFFYQPIFFIWNVIIPRKSIPFYTTETFPIKDCRFHPLIKISIHSFLFRVIIQKTF